jgi:hypothetical protein
MYYFGSFDRLIVDAPNFAIGYCLSLTYGEVLAGSVLPEESSASLPLQSFGQKW